MQNSLFGKSSQEIGVRIGQSEGRRKAYTGYITKGTAEGGWSSVVKDASQLPPKDEPGEAES